MSSSHSPPDRAMKFTRLLDAAATLRPAVASIALTDDLIWAHTRKNLCRASRELLVCIVALPEIEDKANAMEVAAEFDALIAGFDALTARASIARDPRTQFIQGMRARMLAMRATAALEDLIRCLSALSRP